MKKSIFILVTVLLLAGCTSEVQDKLQQSEQVELPAVNYDLVNEYYNRFDKVMIGKVWPVTDHSNYEDSKAMINNALKKISEAEKEISEIEKIAVQVKDEEFVSVNTEYLSLVKQLLAKEKDLYKIELKIAEFTERESRDNKLEELINGIAGCSCDKMDCESYYELTLKHYDDIIETFESIDVKYIQESAEYIRKQKAVMENHIPGLIDKSEMYNERNCYRLNDEYNEFYVDIEAVGTPDDGKMDSAVSEKYGIPIDNLVDEIKIASVDFDRVRAEI